MISKDRQFIGTIIEYDGIKTLMAAHSSSPCAAIRTLANLLKSLIESHDAQPDRILLEKSLLPPYARLNQKTRLVV
jgi:hypothetical protein